jgi:hypothetical protein
MFYGACISLTINPCHIQSSIDHAHCKVLLDRNIFGAAQQLLELADDQMKHSVACIIANLSCAPEKEELLVQHGILGQIQNLNGHVHRTDSMCYLLLRCVPATCISYVDRVAKLYLLFC